MAPIPKFAVFNLAPKFVPRNVRAILGLTERTGNCKLTESILLLPEKGSVKPKLPEIPKILTAKHQRYNPNQANQLKLNFDA